MNPGHGLEEYTRLLNALDGRQIHVTQHVIRRARSSEGVALARGGFDLDALAREVSKRLARMEDEGV